MTPSKLSAANIKYLLALDALCREDKGARCVDLAAVIGVTKPSAHTMLNTLKEMRLLEKGRYGAAQLTEEGRKLAELYGACFGWLCGYLEKILPEEADVKTVVCAMLAEIPTDSIAAMYSHMHKADV